MDIDQDLILRLKKIVTDELPLSKLSDEELTSEIENIVEEQTRGQYFSIQTRVDLVQQVYSSIRGFGLLDSIISDDTITEVMINGPDNIFIEKSGKLTKLDASFESQRRLEDIIQRIVGMAGREVNQANPICDTRLPDGSRVNVVLPPISLCGPILTIRKFSKNPMTIEKLIEYGSITREIADKLELLVRAKYNIFISGGTGSGKSSLVNLIPRFYEATKGSVKIDGVAVEDYDYKALRAKIGMVPQKAVLFKGTIRENLLMGLPEEYKKKLEENPDSKDETIEKMLRDALEISQSAEFVDNKPEGMETMVSQGGKNLSGGQKQRLTIARALVRKPEILILDDSASALDYATDLKLRKAIHGMEKTPVVFIVSQRASSLLAADSIIVLDDGNVAGIGTHDELLASCSVYQEIYYSQYPDKRKEA